MDEGKPGDGGDAARRPRPDRKKEKEHRLQYEEKMLEQIEIDERRKRRWQRKKGRSAWFGLGLSGLVGWMIILPTLLGILIGAWIDENFPSSIPWTLVLMLLGLVFGATSTYFWLMREQKDIQQEREDTE